MTFDELPFDLTQMNSHHMTFEMPGVKLDKTGDDLIINPDSIGAKLTQEETGLFRIGLLEVQTNWKDSSGLRFGSSIETVEITKQLLDEVI